MQCADQSRPSAGRVAFTASVMFVAASLLLSVAYGAAGAARNRVSSVPSAVAATLPLGITGLAANPDGSRTLWVMNVQPTRLTVGGASIFSIVDVTFRAQPGYKLKIRTGSNCSLIPGNGTSTIECLPTVEANQLVPLVTFTSNRPYPATATQTVELNSSSSVTQASNLALPRTVRSAAAIRAYLAKRFDSLGGAKSTIVYVDAGKPSEYAYTLSKTSVPVGWVTFVVTNRGRLAHSFEVCPSSGTTEAGNLRNDCLQTQAGSSYAQEVDDTGSLSPGETGFFTMRFTSRGKYEYLSDLSGQPAKGAKAQLTVN